MGCHPIENLPRSTSESNVLLVVADYNDEIIDWCAARLDEKRQPVISNGHQLGGHPTHWASHPVMLCEKPSSDSIKIRFEPGDAVLILYYHEDAGQSVIPRKMSGEDDLRAQQHEKEVIERLGMVILFDKKSR